MKETRLLMGMPITVEIVAGAGAAAALDSTFAYFAQVDAQFSTYKENSEISRINRRELDLDQASPEMKTVFALSEQTRQETGGYFDIRRNGAIDPSGLVKGWAIYHAAERLRQMGFRNFYVEAGGDVQVVGRNGLGENWRVGIRNPFAPDEIVKVLALSDCGVATSGTYVRGQHIYNPNDPGALQTDVVSLTVIGPNIYEADRFATAAFAMGREGILFIERLEGFEGYMIDAGGTATFTGGFARYVSDD